MEGKFTMSGSSFYGKSPFKKNGGKFNFKKNKGFNFKNKGDFDFTKTNKYIDPDAPGTPGTPGYEPQVKRSDLDDEGKKIWDKKNKK